MTCRSSIGSSSAATVTGTVDVAGTVGAYPAGLTKGFKITAVAINDASWTLLPQTATRQHITIQNLAGTGVSLNSDYFAALPLDDFGYSLRSGAEVNFAATDAVKLYAKCASGTGPVTINTVEMA